MNKQTAQLLEQHFDAAFAAPDGIAKLRELILTLAMQGKLVEQDPSDPPASELLEEIEAEKQRSVKAGKIKQPKLLSAIKPEEIPYELPRGWEWVKLGTITEVNGGYAFKSSKYSNEGVRVIRISDFDEKGFKADKIVRYPYSDDLSNFNLEKNNILMAMTGGTVGKSLLVKVLPEPMVVNQRVATIKMSTGVLPEFVNGLIRTNLIQSVIQAAKNSTNDNISMGDITGFFVPLPPLSEQHRIVARIDQLMARCDELEKLRKARETQRLAVHTAAIKQLLDAPDGSAWNFIQQHFGELYTVKQNVAELRKAILQLAVMGRLVEQDPNDPPASELLKEIEAEKQRLVKAGKIKKPKPLPPIKPEEVPYQLPQGWEWVRLGSALIKITDGTHHSPPNNETGDFLYVSAKNIKDNGVLLSNATFVTKEVHDEIFSRCDPECGDILYIKDGATTGVVTINNLKEPFSMLSSVALLKQPKQVDNRYLLFTLRSPFFYTEMRAGMTGVAITRVTLKKLHDAIVPLPPLPEQYRIVACIEHMMALCDTLEQQIAASTEKQSELLSALLNAQPHQHNDITDLAAYRSTIGCYIVKNMAASQYFGRTTAAKTLYLAQAHAGLNLDLHPVREAAGPFDKRIYDFEREGESNGWFKVKEKKIKAGHTKTEYAPMPGLKTQASQAETAMTAENRKQLDNLIGLLKDKTTEEVEIIATLFAAWNDFLIDGIKPSDDKIITEVRENWHERKSRFSPKKLSQWLDWMRSKKLVPQGRSPKTIQQYRLEL